MVYFFSAVIASSSTFHLNPQRRTSLSKLQYLLLNLLFYIYYNYSCVAYLPNTKDIRKPDVVQQKWSKYNWHLLANIYL